MVQLHSIVLKVFMCIFGLLALYDDLCTISGACFNGNSCLGGQFACSHSHHQGYASLQSRKGTVDRTGSPRCHAGNQRVRLFVCSPVCPSGFKNDF